MLWARQLGGVAVPFVEIVVLGLRTQHDERAVNSAPGEHYHGNRSAPGAAESTCACTRLARAVPAAGSGLLLRTGLRCLPPLRMIVRLRS